MKPDPEEVIGESEYSINQTLPIDMNDEYISLAFNDFTHDLSDEEIRFNASYLLRVHQEIDAEDVTLECEDGVITLNGVVDNEDMKMLCTRLCSVVPGVKDVINNLTWF
ncbi:MAG: BON domain-containing protein [Candidatus Caldatribacteriota bacterium]